MEPDKPEVMIPLRELIAKAKREKKWLWQRYHDMWLSPEELTVQNKAGKFRWGVVNWDLRDPMELLSNAREKVSKAIAEETNIAERMRKYK